MIAFLSGEIRRKSAGHVVIVVGNGTGYKVNLSARNLEVLPAAGEHVDLEIETVVREDEITLYGFVDAFEARFFSALLSVSGIGPKTALNILEQTRWETLLMALKQEDVTKIRALKGVGEKTARLMLLGLKNKISEFDIEWQRRHLGTVGQGSGASADDLKQDVEKALIGLGYHRTDIRKTLARIEMTPETPLQSVIKQSLKFLSGEAALD